MKTAASWVEIWRSGEFGSDMIWLAGAIQRDAAEAQRERMAFAAQAWWSDIDGFPTGTELGDMLRGVPLVSCPK
jgi:hypothetical protein